MSVTLAIEVTPTGTVGAEVKGVDIAAAGSAEIEAIKRAWYRHDVLVFRNQRLTDDDLLAFSRHFGSSVPQCLENARRSSSVSLWLRNTRTSCRYQARLIASISADPAAAMSTPLTSAPTVPVGVTSM